MMKQLSPSYFEACMASTISREAEASSPSEQQTAELKLYSKAQLCRDEAYKKPGFAGAIIKRGSDYGAFVELPEKDYIEIAEEYSFSSIDESKAFKEEVEHAETDLPHIEVYSLDEVSEKPKIIMLGKFQFIPKIEEAKKILKSYTSNLLIVNNAADRENT